LRFRFNAAAFANSQIYMPLRVCVVTSAAASAEPRAPRHAIAISHAIEDVDVLFVDCAPAGHIRQEPEELLANVHVRRKTICFSHRGSRPINHIMSKVAAAMAKVFFLSTDIVLPPAVGARIPGIASTLCKEPADIFFAHNLETLMPAARAAEKFDAKLMFDCMEFYSDMGEGQTDLEKHLVREVERKWLPRCALVTASSDQLAEALSNLYRIRRPVALYNTAPVETQLPEKVSGAFHLYWRNAVIGVGQRGLEDAFMALRQLPSDIILNIQGRLQLDGGAAVQEHVKNLGIADRVVIHPPFLPHQAVREAARYTVGLCLERRVCTNHELTVSNKIFDYLMGGLAVVASNLSGLRGVVERTGGGLLFEPGSPDDLARQIRRLYEDPVLLNRLAAAGRAFALAEGNREATAASFIEQFRAAI
jgi:glycosyltransferase involved in cell wall biosynthesis